MSHHVAVMRAGRIVEAGHPPGPCLSNPAEAYTRDLMAAVPIPDPNCGEPARAA